MSQDAQDQIDPATLKVEFAEGCFDDFDGTQEELDEFVKEIQRLIHSGEFLENAQPLPPDEALALEAMLANKGVRQ